ncbi:MAG: acylphosphatase [Lachnospiraceae bacterium]|nr:acylphosphatase [Lachnospiraceae bacterium]
MDKIRKHFVFSGAVQGVGFRYRARYLAQTWGLTGWVRNTWDDRVELELQGAEAAIEQFLADLYRQPFLEIDSVEVETMTLEDERGFHIRD